MPSQKNKPLKMPLNILLFILLFASMAIAVSFFMIGKGNENKNLNTNSEIANNIYENPIHVTWPQPNEKTQSPLNIGGLARGFWFFEASFPVELIDSDGNLLGSAAAQAQSDWMTENFVPFKAIIEFENPKTAEGLLVFKKDNPTGLPENDQQYSIPIKFEISDIVAGECIITGCSGQLCAESEVITTCEYLPQYDCLSKSVCEIQPDGKCGWTPTLEFIECIENIEVELPKELQ